MAKQRPLWRCPKCGAGLVTRNLWHSCGRHSLQALFARSEPHVFRLYQKYVRMARRCGRIQVIPQKTRIVFVARVRYAGCVPRKSHLQCSVALLRPTKHPRFVRIESYGRHWHGHRFHIHRLEELDAQVQRWLRESYRIGRQEHLLGR